MTQPVKLTRDQHPSTGVKVHISHLFRQGLADYFDGIEHSVSWLQNIPAHVEAYRMGRELGRRIEEGELAFEHKKKGDNGS